MMRGNAVRVLRVAGFAVTVLVVSTGCLGPQQGPTAVLFCSVLTGPAPLDVGFDLSFSNHPRDLPMTFELDFGDGSEAVAGSEFSLVVHHTYQTGGVFQATLDVVDENGRTSTDTVTITVDEDGPEVGLNLGDLAPDFTGHTTDGQEVTLSDYRGSVVLLDFWGSWCTPCQQSMPHLDDLMTRYGEQGLVILIVSTDLVRQDAINFLSQRGFVQFISLWEPGGKNGNFIDLLYDVTLYPTTFVLDKQGVIRWISIGYPGTLSDQTLELLLAAP